MNSILQSILDAVSVVTEVSQELIVSENKRRDVVLARKLFVYFCYEYGFPTASVAQAANKTSRCVRRLYNERTGDEYRTIYRIYQDRIRTELGTKDAAA